MSDRFELKAAVIALRALAPSDPIAKGESTIRLRYLDRKRHRAVVTLTFARTKRVVTLVRSSLQGTWTVRGARTRLALRTGPKNATLALAASLLKLQSPPIDLHRGLPVEFGGWEQSYAGFRLIYDPRKSWGWFAFEANTEGRLRNFIPGE